VPRVWAANWCDDVNNKGCWQMNVDEDPITDDSGEGQHGDLLALGMIG